MFLGEGEALGEGLGEGRGEGRGDGRDEAGLEPRIMNHIVYFVQLTVLDPGKEFQIQENAHMLETQIMKKKTHTVR